MRERIVFNDNWLFHGQSGEERVTLPHTWNRDDGYTEKLYLRGVFSYRKEFEYSLEENRRLYVEFEGVNSSSSVMGAMLKDLGCINLADSESSLLENLSIEYILQEDPEYIFITQRGDDTEGMKKAVEKYFQEHPLWYELSAVKEGKVFFMDKNLYNLKPNHRWGEAYRILQEILTDES